MWLAPFAGLLYVFAYAQVTSILLLIIGDSLLLFMLNGKEKRKIYITRFLISLSIFILASILVMIFLEATISDTLLVSSLALNIYSTIYGIILIIYSQIIKKKKGKNYSNSVLERGIIWIVIAVVVTVLILILPLIFR